MASWSGAWGRAHWTTRTYGRNWPQIALLRLFLPSVTCYLGGYDRRGRAGATRLSGQLQSGPAHGVRTVFTCPAQKNSSPKVGAGCRKRVSPPPGRRVVPPEARVLGAEASSSVHERRRFRLAARSPTGTSAGRRRSPGRRNPQRRILRATRLVPLLDGHSLTRPVTRWIETLCRSSRNRKYGVADLWQCWLGLPMRGSWSVHGPDLGSEESADAGGDGQRPRSGASRIGPSRRQPRGPGRRRGRRHGH